MRHNGRRALYAAGTLTALVALYWRALNFPFVCNDGMEVVYSQIALRHLSALKLLASPYYFEAFGEGGYRPLTTLAYMLTFRLLGPEPLAFKLVKFVLHFGCATLVYVLARRLIEDRRWSLLAAASYFVLFMFPVFNGVSFYPDILAAFFLLASLTYYLRATSRSRVSGFEIGAAVACFALALLAKETSVLLPGALLAHRCLLLKRGPDRDAWRDIKEHLPFWTVFALYLLFLRGWIRAESFYGPVHWTWLPPFGAAIRKLCGYWAFFILGAPVSAYLLATTAYAVVLRRRPSEALARSLFFMAAWSVCALLPVTGLFPFPKFSSYLSHIEPHYMAFAGAAMACAMGRLGSEGNGSPLLDRAIRWVAWGTIALHPILLAMFPAMSAGTSSFGRMPASPEAPLTWAMRDILYSTSLIRQADPARFSAIERGFGRPVAAFFGDASLYRDPGVAHAATRILRSARTVSDLQKEVKAVRWEADPNLRRIAQMYLDKGDILPFVHLAKTGDYNDGAGFRMLAEGRYAEALNWFDGGRPGLQFHPIQRVEVLDSRADTLIRLKRYQEAKKEFGEILKECERLKPSPSPLSERDQLERFRLRAERESAWLQTGARQAYELAMNDFERGDKAAARRGFAQAIRLSPDFSEAYLSLGALYASQGRLDRALELDHQALALDHGRMDPAIRTLLSSDAAALSKRPR